MNRKNLLRVADAIEKHEIAWLGYNQNLWITGALPDMSGHDCGTTACIAGWAYVVSTGEQSEYDARKNHDDAVGSIAARWLELNTSESSLLFLAAPFGDEDATSEQAIRTLRYAAEHGMIDWRAANPGAAS